jgi:hypothetical protein
MARTLVEVITPGGERLPLRDYAAHSGVTRQAVTKRARWNVQEQAWQLPASAPTKKRARCRTPDGRVMFIADYAREVGRFREALYKSARWDRHAGLWIVAPSRRQKPQR